MKLDRNVNRDGRGKYGLIKVRLLANATPYLQSCVHSLRAAGILDWGDSANTEFFVIRLKDKYAAPALRAYSGAAFADDMEYSKEISEMAIRAQNHISKRKPD